MTDPRIAELIAALDQFWCWQLPPKRIHDALAAVRGVEWVEAVPDAPQARCPRCNGRVESIGNPHDCPTDVGVTENCAVCEDANPVDAAVGYHSAQARGMVSTERSDAEATAYYANQAADLAKRLMEMMSENNALRLKLARIAKEASGE